MSDLRLVLAGSPSRFFHWIASYSSLNYSDVADATCCLFTLSMDCQLTLKDLVQLEIQLP